MMSNEDHQMFFGPNGVATWNILGYNLHSEGRSSFPFSLGFPTGLFALNESFNDSWWFGGGVGEEKRFAGSCAVEHSLSGFEQISAHATTSSEEFYLKSFRDNLMISIVSFRNFLFLHFFSMKSVVNDRTLHVFLWHFSSFVLFFLGMKWWVLWWCSTSGEIMGQ